MLSRQWNKIYRRNIFVSFHNPLEYIWKCHSFIFIRLWARARKKRDEKVVEENWIFVSDGGVKIIIWENRFFLLLVANKTLFLQTKLEIFILLFFAAPFFWEGLKIYTTLLSFWVIKCKLQFDWISSIKSSVHLSSFQHIQRIVLAHYSLHLFYPLALDAI